MRTPVLLFALSLVAAFAILASPVQGGFFSSSYYTSTTFEYDYDDDDENTEIPDTSDRFTEPYETSEFPIILLSDDSDVDSNGAQSNTITDMLVLGALMAMAIQL